MQSQISIALGASLVLPDKTHWFAEGLFEDTLQPLPLPDIRNPVR